ncbi:hypothetical protein FSP39_014575 [Pinctada imbricata]|uniref:Neurotransmitter-gated ion-channel transmembrane domain-containing protein n=1 Tax=Pinctada imbricata TaxID=66713 RepID=A0AA88Y4W8_PINIB|nr:hypothetical protein FSP39_014575 [Pinctada imbricata]
MESQLVSKFQHSTLKNDTCDTNVHLITTYRDSLNTDETISLLEGDKPCPAMSREYKPSTLDTILKYIKTIVTKHEEDEEEEEIVDEWKQVSLVVDRLLFWIFLFITLFSTIIILVVVPSFSYSMTGGI